MPTKSKFDLFGQHVLVIVGKGGTGRTTLARTLATLASRNGKKVSVIAGTTGTHFENKCNPNVTFTSLEPGEVLINYLDDHGLGQLGKRLSSSGLATIISTAIPGIADLLVLAKIKQIEQSNTADLIIFDAPASGHFLRLIATPTGLSNIASAGPLQKQSQDVLEMLHDPKRLGVACITIPEETPVKESIETMESLKKSSGIAPRALFINSVLPVLPKEALSSMKDSQNTPSYLAAEFIAARNLSQAESKKLAEKELKLTPIEIPQIPTADLNENDIEILADAIESQIVGKP